MPVDFPGNKTGTAAVFFKKFTAFNVPAVDQFHGDWWGETPGEPK